MKGCVKRSVEISKDSMDIITRYADINYMTVSQVIRMILDKWAKNARYSVELFAEMNEGMTCPDREDPTV